MVFGWILILIAAMVSTRAAVKKEQDRTSQEETKNVLQEYSESEEQDWEEICREIQQVIDEEGRFTLKNKKHMKPCPTVKQYARRKSFRSSGIHISEPLAGEQSLPKESPWIEGGNAPSASSLPPSASRKDTTEVDKLMSSICKEQRRLSSDQEIISIDIEHISAEQRRIRTKMFQNVEIDQKDFSQNGMQQL